MARRSLATVLSRRKERSFVFISYRREESAGHAGRIFDAISSHLGEDRVFIDIEMNPGDDFVNEIERAVNACRVFIAVIGDRWTSIEDGHGRPRLDDEHDYVRLEVGAALARGVRVIPALVQGARMPTAEELPDELAPLVRRNALPVTDVGWRDDVARLCRAVDSAMREPAPEPKDGLRRRLAQFVAPLVGLLGRGRRGPRREGIARVLGFVLLVLVVLGALLVRGLADGDPPLESAPIATQVGYAPRSLAVDTERSAIWLADFSRPEAWSWSTAPRHVTRRTPLDAASQPVAVDVGWGAAWVTDQHNDLLWRVDTETKDTQSIEVGDQPQGVAVGTERRIWVANARARTLLGIRARRPYRRLGAPVPLGRRAGKDSGAKYPWGVDVHDGYVWVIDTTPDHGVIWRVREDADSPQRTRVTDVDGDPVKGGQLSSVAATNGAVWVTDVTGTVLRIDPETATLLSRFRLRGAPCGVAARGGAVWVTDAARDRLMRLDALTGEQVGKPIRVGTRPCAVTVSGDGAVWVANRLDNSVSRYAPSPRTGPTGESAQVASDGAAP
jgi:DNA-binding beta-propeller fold protein YncE